MAIGGYLPPLVTELEGNVRPLAEAFAEGETLAEAYSEKMDATLTDGMHNAGQHSAEAFDKEVQSGVDKTFKDAKGRVRGERNQFADEGRALGNALINGLEDAVNPGGGGGGGSGGAGGAGRKAGQSFISQFISGASAIGENFTQILIGAAVIAAPAIAAAIGTALAIALPLVFAGIGVAIAAAMLPSVQKAFQKLADPIRSAFKYAISGAFDNALLGAIKEFSKYIPMFRGPLRAVFDAVAPIMKPLADALGKSITVFLQSLATTLKQSQPVIIEFLNKLPDLVKSFGDFLVSVTENGPALVRFLDDSLNFLEKFITDSGKVISWLTGVYDWVVKLNDKSPIEFIGWTRSFEGLKIAWNAVTKWISGAWDKTVAWFKKTGEAIGNWFNDLPKKITKFFSNASSWLTNAGEDMVKGLIKGVKNMWKSAMDDIKGFGNGLVDAFKGVMHISSPSGVFAELGGYLVAGLVQGVQTGQDRAQRSVNGMIQAGASWAGGGAYALAGAAPVGGGYAAYAAPMVHTTVMVNDRAIVEAITPSTQRRKARSGTSGMA